MNKTQLTKKQKEKSNNKTSQKNNAYAEEIRLRTKHLKEET